MRAGELPRRAESGHAFFQNLTSFGVGYLTINPFMGDGRFDEGRLDAMPAVYESESVRHVRFDTPLYIYIDGRKTKASSANGRHRTTPPGERRPVLRKRSSAGRTPADVIRPALPDTGEP